MARVVFAIYGGVAWFVGRLSITAVFRLGWMLGLAAYHLAGPYRRLAQRNLGIAFGEEKSAAQVRALAREHFATLGANLLSSLKLPQLSEAELRAVVTVEGLGLLARRERTPGGFVIAISHLGSWEMFAQLSPIFFGCKVGTVFQALSNAHIDAAVRRSRARLGLALFERKQGLIQASHFLREGGAVGVLIDQHAGDAGLWCPFFGKLASTSTLAATLALRAGASLVPAAVYTAGVARWRCVILPPIDTAGQSADALTARLNLILEDQIRVQPADWFWVHNRWKRPQPRFLLETYKRGVLLPPGADPRQDLKPFRILIRASNWLGDAIMSVPAVRAIKGGRIDAHVTILTPAKLADLWKTVPEVDEIIAIEPGESVFAVARKIRRDFEVAILFPNSLRVALEVRLAGIARRVGYAGHSRRGLLNQVFIPKKKQAPAPAPHQAHQYLALANYVGAVIPKGAGSFAPAARRAGRSAPILGLCPGAEYGPAKRWLPERFAEVVREVQARRGAEWRIFGVANDLPVAATIAAAAGAGCVNRTGQTTLAQLIEELRACDLLLTNDTGTMHLAAYLGVRTVSIFGSTEPALTGPLGPQHTVVRHHVACSPCFLRECPIDFRCMNAVGVSEVVEAVLAALPTATHRGAVPSGRAP